MAARRNLLAGLGALGLAAGPGKASSIIDPHHAWRVEERRIHAEMMAAFAAGDEDRANDLNDRRWELRDLIIETPATTSQGHALRIRLIAESEEEGLDLGPDCFAALRSVADDIERMTGRAG